jgi:hypothetical protein
VDWAGFEPATSRSFGGHTVIASTHTLACEASITTAELPALSLCISVIKSQYKIWRNA